MRNRVSYIFFSFVALTGIFVAAKAVFMLYNSGARPFAIGDLGDVIAHGLTLDMSTALWLVAVPYVLVGVSMWTGKAWAAAHKVYWAVVALVLSVALAGDTCLYEYWGFKLDAAVIQYIEAPEGIARSVTWQYLAARAVAVVIAAAVMWLVLTACVPRRIARLTPRGKAVFSVVWAAGAAAVVVGIRGGVGVSTTNIGQVYFSQTQYLNHAAVNPVFSFVASAAHTDRELANYNFFPDKVADEWRGRLYTTESVGTDSLLTTSRPDIVIILMESCGGVFTAIGGRTDIMPHLDSIARGGVTFTRCYGNSWRTDRGTVCALSGYPAFPRLSVMKMPEKSRTLPSIARSLRRHGYSTAFLHGGDVNFTNMRSYLVSGGYERITSVDDYTREQYGTAKWGVRDDITFDTLYDMITAKSTGGARSLITFLTLSSHEPWDVPDNTFPDSVLNAFHYLDSCVGTLVERLKATPQWDSLLIVMLPDHGIPYGTLDNTAELYYHIPMIWTGGAVKEHRDVNAICNQTDLAATLLGQMGISHDEFAFSRDVLSSSYTAPFAVNMFSGGMMVTDSTGFIVYDMNADRYAAAVSTRPDSLLTIGRAVLQITSEDFKNR